MPRWFVSRPIELCHESELDAYQGLNKLDDTWTIRWGYQYPDGGSAREGDFLILGPDGRLVVMEVKKRARFFMRTGRADGKNSLKLADDDQVQAQKGGVVQALLEAFDKDAGDTEVPFVTPMLFSSKVTEGLGFIPRSRGFPISVMSGAEALETLPAHWEAITAGGTAAKDPEKVLRLFAKVYGDASPEAEALFLKATDHLMLDRMSAKMDVLKSLEANQQLLICGGPGSGKTWLAERFALELAKAGNQVLFLCYNKALGAGFQRDLPRLTGKGKGSVTAHTWESFAIDLADRFGVKLPEKPGQKASKAAMQTYYEETMPEAMLEAVLSSTFQPQFDALVVDEAQDHNTSPVDWWEIYLTQLREGGKARIGIFYDVCQRPSFRSGGFDVAALSRQLSQPAYFTLRDTLRYTWPVFEFLRSLQSAETQSLVEGLQAGSLPSGPDVLLQEKSSLDKAKSSASRLLKKWFKEKLVEPGDTLVLTRADPFGSKKPVFHEGESFAGQSIIAADYPDATKRGVLRACSFHKSKGLDARAVVLLDTYAWEDLPPGQRVGFWIAASRSRQLLAIFQHKK